MPTTNPLIQQIPVLPSVAEDSPLVVRNEGNRYTYGDPRGLPNEFNPLQKQMLQSQLDTLGIYQAKQKEIEDEIAWRTALLGSQSSVTLPPDFSGTQSGMSTTEKYTNPFDDPNLGIDAGRAAPWVAGGTDLVGAIGGAFASSYEGIKSYINDPAEAQRKADAAREQAKKEGVGHFGQEMAALSAIAPENSYTMKELFAIGAKTMEKSNMETEGWAGALNAFARMTVGLGVSSKAAGALRGAVVENVAGKLTARGLSAPAAKEAAEAAVTRSIPLRTSEAILASQPVAAQAAAMRYSSARQAGATDAQAMGAAGMGYMVDSAMFALPPALRGGAVKRFASGAAINAVGGIGSQVAANTQLPDKYKYDPMEEVALDGAMGGIVGLLFGRAPNVGSVASIARKDLKATREAMANPDTAPPVAEIARGPQTQTDDGTPPPPVDYSAMRSHLPKEQVREVNKAAQSVVDKLNRSRVLVTDEYGDPILGTNGKRQFQKFTLDEIRDDPQGALNKLDAAQHGGAGRTALEGYINDVWKPATDEAHMRREVGHTLSPDVVRDLEQLDATGRNLFAQKMGWNPDYFNEAFERARTDFAAGKTSDFSPQTWNYVLGRYVDAARTAGAESTLAARMRDAANRDAAAADMQSRVADVTGQNRSVTDAETDAIRQAYEDARDADAQAAFDATPVGGQIPLPWMRGDMEAPASAADEAPPTPTNPLVTPDEVAAARARARMQGEATILDEQASRIDNSAAPDGSSGDLFGYLYDRRLFGDIKFSLPAANAAFRRMLDSPATTVNEVLKALDTLGRSRKHGPKVAAEAKANAQAIRDRMSQTTAGERADPDFMAAARRADELRKQAGDKRAAARGDDALRGDGDTAGPRSSRPDGEARQRPQNPSTFGRVVGAIRSRLGPLSSKLLDPGYTVILSDKQFSALMREFPNDITEANRGDQAFWFRDKVYMLPHNIERGNEFGVWMHEVMHRGEDNLYRTEDFNKLRSDVQSWAEAPAGSVERQAWDAAKRRAEEAGNPNREIIPYLVEELVNRGVKPSQRFVKSPDADVKAKTWLSRVRDKLVSLLPKVIRKSLNQRIPKPDPSNFTAQDVVSLAHSAALHELPAGKAGPHPTPPPPDHYDGPNLRGEHESERDYNERVYRERTKNPEVPRDPQDPVNKQDIKDVKKDLKDAENHTYYGSITRGNDDKLEVTIHQTDEGDWVASYSDGTVRQFPDLEAARSDAAKLGMQTDKRSTSSSKPESVTYSDTFSSSSPIARAVGEFVRGLASKFVPEYANMAATRGLAAAQWFNQRYLSEFDWVDRIDRSLKSQGIELEVPLGRAIRNRMRSIAALTQGRHDDIITTARVTISEGMKHHGIDEQTINRYAYARHVEERNARYADRTYFGTEIKMPDDIAAFEHNGMTGTEAAKAYMDSIPAAKRQALDNLLSVYDDLRQEVLAQAYQSGRISGKTYSQWGGKDANGNIQEGAWEFYVPLKNREKAGMPREEIRQGRNTEAAPPLTVAFADLQKMMMDAQANMAWRELDDVLQKYPDPRMFKREEANAVDVDGNGNFVWKREDPMLDRSLLVFRDGKAYRLTSEDPNFKFFLEQRGATTGALQVMAAGTHMFALTRTALNPAFFVKAPVWDVFSILGNMQAASDGRLDLKQSMRTSKQAIRYAAESLKALSQRAVQQKYEDPYLRVYGRDGGGVAPGQRLGFRQSEEAWSAAGIPISGRDGAVSSLVDIKDRIKDVLHVPEEAARFGTFRAAVEEMAGRKFTSVDDLDKWAATNRGDYELALEMSRTIIGDFDDRGSAKFMRAGYVFFNPSMQSARTMLKSLQTRQGQIMWSIMAASGAMAAGALFGDTDEDGTNKLVRSKNRESVMSLGDDKGIPIPPEMRVPMLFGSNLVLLANGETTPSRAAAEVARAALGSFFPFQVPEGSNPAAAWGMAAAPTVLQPVAMATFGVNNFGRPLQTEEGKTYKNGQRLENPAAFERAVAGTDPRWTAIAEGLYEATDGKLDFYPGRIREVVKAFAGGTYNIAKGVEAGDEEAIADALSGGYNTEYDTHVAKDEYERAIAKRQQGERLNGNPLAASVPGIKPPKSWAAINEQALDKITVGGLTEGQIYDKLREAENGGNPTMTRQYNMLLDEMRAVKARFYAQKLLEMGNE